MRLRSLVALSALLLCSMSVSITHAKKPTCGDGICAKTENTQTCAQDCPNPCGNGTCEKRKGENTQSCPADCSIPCAQDGQSLKSGQQCCTGLSEKQEYSVDCKNGVPVKCSPLRKPVCKGTITNPTAKTMCSMLASCKGSECHVAAGVWQCPF